MERILGYKSYVSDLECSNFFHVMIIWPFVSLYDEVNFTKLKQYFTFKTIFRSLLIDVFQCLSVRTCVKHVVDIGFFYFNLFFNIFTSSY